jgi:hypothetical protein
MVTTGSEAAQAGAVTGGAAAQPVAVPKGPPTSLVSNQTNGGRDSTGLSPRNLCPRIDHSRRYWVNTWTGEKRPAFCQSQGCPVCGPREAWKKSLIISHGGKSGPPKRYAVLSQFPLDWQKGRQKMRDLPRLLEKRGYRWDQTWTVEVNPAGTGLHVNVLQKGSYVPQGELQDVWGAIVHIQAIKSRKGAQKVGTYALKEAQTVAGYAVKDAAQHTAQHLDVNGGRLIHCSRGYLGGMTQKDVWSDIRGPHVDAGWRMVVT